MPSALLIYNPMAGRRDPEPLVQAAADTLTRSGWTVESRPTRDAAHVTDLARQAAHQGIDALIVAGGDGSLGLAARGLLESGTALGVLPTGTANVWAKELGLPNLAGGNLAAIHSAASLLANGEVRSVDVGMCNGVPFLLWAGLGLDALVVRRAESKRSHLKKRLAVPEYALRTLLTAASWPGAELKLTARRTRADEHTETQGRFQFAIASNIRLYAGGLAALSPQARLDDGEMDLWLFKGQGSIAALRHAWNLMRGKHVHKSDVECIPFRRLSIEAHGPLQIHLDGDPRPDSAAVELEVLPGVLKILRPETAPQHLFSP